MISLNVVGSPLKCIVKFFTAFVVNKAVIVAFVFYNQQCVPEDFVNCKHVTFSNVGFRGTNQSSKAGGMHIGNLKTRNDTKWNSAVVYATPLRVTIDIHICTHMGAVLRVIR